MSTSSAKKKCFFWCSSFDWSFLQLYLPIRPLHSLPSHDDRGLEVLFREIGAAGAEEGVFEVEEDGEVGVDVAEEDALREVADAQCGEAGDAVDVFV